VLTVATEDNEALGRYLRSARVYALNVKVLGLGQEWNGGDVRTSPGGGQKVNLVKTEMEQYKDETDKIVMFTDRSVFTRTGIYKEQASVPTVVIRFVSFCI